MAEEYTMEDLINESLFNKKPKKKRKPKKIKESKTDIKEIIGEAEEKRKKDKKDKEIVDDASTLDAHDATAEASKEKTHKKEAKGKLVMTVNLTISDSDQGKLEIGQEEYGSITNINSLLSLYDINTKNLVDPEKSTDTLNLVVQEEVSNSDKNNISLMMRSNIDGTLSINILVNELGQPFDNIDNAIQYFNQQYQNNILNIINKEVHA